MATMNFIEVMLIFVLAEHLIWLWVIEEKPIWYGLLDAILLIFYGFVATFQLNNFARTYAAYGSIFIIMSLIWAYEFDCFKPDKFDIIGAIITFMGISIIFFTKW